jgi:prephenate dehydrogenase
MLETPAFVIGCHPIFGPVPDPAGQNVVLCPARPGPFLDWYRELFTSHGMHVEVMEAEAHDRAMGLVQGLLHFVNVTFARSLQSSGASANDLLRVSSPVYRLFFATLGRILSGDPALYSAIQVRNPWTRTTVRDFLRDGQELLGAIERNDEPAFQRVFDEAAAFLGESRGEARAESEWIIEHPRPRSTASPQSAPAKNAAGTTAARGKT